MSLNFPSLEADLGFITRKGILLRGLGHTAGLEADIVRSDSPRKNQAQNHSPSPVNCQTNQPILTLPLHTKEVDFSGHRSISFKRSSHPGQNKNHGRWRKGKTGMIAVRFSGKISSNLVAAESDGKDLCSTNLFPLISKPLFL